MTYKFPDTIKIQVIKAWIQGISRDKIAQENNIGTGTVTGIIQQTKSDTPDMDFPADKSKVIQFIKQSSDNNQNKDKILSALDKLEEKSYKNVSEVTTNAGLVRH